MDRASSSLGSNATAAAVLRELRGERPGAEAGSPDQFVASATGGSLFSHHLRSLRDGSPTVIGSQAATRQESGPDSYLSRSAPGIVRRTFERSPAAPSVEVRGEGELDVSRNSARTLHAEARKP